MSPQVESPQPSESRPQIANLNVQPLPPQQQGLNMPLYLNCFKKATTILEKFKSVSEALLEKSLEENAATNPALRAQMNMSMKAFIPGFKGILKHFELKLSLFLELICDIQALETPQVNQYQFAHPAFYGFSRAVPFPNPAIFGFHPLFALANQGAPVDKILQ